MPIYEYQCAQCQAVVEKLQKISDPPLTVCEQCQGSLHKKISQSSFSFKGSGWYVTDYAKKSAAPAASPSTTTSTTTETKPAETKEASSEASATTPACGAPACGTGACGTPSNN